MDQLNKALKILLVSLAILGLFFLAVLGYAIYQKLKTGGPTAPTAASTSFNPLELTPEKKAAILQKLAPPITQQQIPKEKKEGALKQLQSSNTSPAQLSTPDQESIAQDYQAKKKLLEQLSPK